MNYHLKTIIRKDYKKKDGTCPICLRITLDRKVKNISLFKSVEEKHWDEETGYLISSSPSMDSTNLLIKSHFKRASDIIFKYEVQNTPLTFELFDLEFRKQKSENYFDFVMRVLDNNHKSNEYSPETIHTYTTEVSKLKQFKKNLTIQCINRLN